MYNAHKEEYGSEIERINKTSTVCDLREQNEI